jgi:hypothetical protein
MGVACSALRFLPLAGREWWVIEGTVLTWLGLLTAVTLWRRTRDTHLLVLLVLTSLNYVAMRPGGWYSRACPTPQFGEVSCDGQGFWMEGQRLLAGANPWAGGDTWYPPTSVQLFSLLARLGPSSSFAALWLCHFLAYASCVTLTLLLARRWHPSGLVSPVLTALLWLHDWPLMQAAGDLQTTTFVIALVLGSWLAFRRSAPLSAVLAVLATAIKPAPLVLAFIVVVAGNLRWGLWYAVFLGATALASVGIGPPGLWREYAGYLRHGGPVPWDTVALDSCLRALLGAKAGPIATIAVKAALLALCLRVVYIARRLLKGARSAAEPQASDVAFAVGSYCMMVLPPIVWSHYRLWAIPVLLLAWGLGRGTRFATLAVATTALVVWLPVLPSMPGLLQFWLAAALLLWCASPGWLAPSGEDSWLSSILRKATSGDRGARADEVTEPGAL